MSKVPKLRISDLNEHQSIQLFNSVKQIRPGLRATQEFFKPFSWTRGSFLCWVSHSVAPRWQICKKQILKSLKHLEFPLWWEQQTVLKIVLVIIQGANVPQVPFPHHLAVGSAIHRSSLHSWVGEWFLDGELAPGLWEQPRPLRTGTSFITASFLSLGPAHVFRPCSPIKIQTTKQ